MGAERTLVVVAYDIPSDRRRGKMADILLGFGARIQGSVYELWLTKRDIERCWLRLTALAEDGDLDAEIAQCLHRCLAEAGCTARDDGGNRAVEFHCVLPVLILLQCDFPAQSRLIFFASDHL